MSNIKSSSSIGTSSATTAKASPNVPNSTSKNSKSTETKKPVTNEGDDVLDFWYDSLPLSPPDEETLKKYKSEMKMEINPKKMTVSVDTPLQVSMKCLADKKQELVVELDSFLFVILNPRAFRGTKSQIYCLIDPGETLNFQIGIMKETGPGVHESDLPALKKPEGKLTIYHGTTWKTDDTDRSWVGIAAGNAQFEEWDWNEDGDYVMQDSKPYSVEDEKRNENRRIVKIKVLDVYEHGILEQEMFLEKETDLTKKRRTQFEEILKKEEKRLEREKKRKEEKEMEKKKKEEMKKKKKCCVIL